MPSTLGTSLWRPHGKTVARQIESLQVLDLWECGGNGLDNGVCDSFRLEKTDDYPCEIHVNPCKHQAM